MEDRVVFVLCGVMFVVGVMIGVFIINDMLPRKTKLEVSGGDVELVLSALCVDEGFSPTVVGVTPGNNSYTVNCMNWNMNVSVLTWN